MKNLQATPEIVMFYPSRSLTGQLKSWSDSRGARQTRISFERTLSGIRRQMQGVDFAVIDATEDPAQAADAFFQILNALGSESMAMYTEITHEGLEILVRRVGVSLLLGPMSVSEWDDLFVHKFPRIIPLTSAQGALSQNTSAEQARSEEKPVSQPYPFRSIAG